MNTTKNATRAPAVARILIVDDEVEIAENLRDILAMKDYEALLAHDPERAIETAGRERPDLVMLDINLGAELDGIETAERIQQRYSVPVVYVTGYCDEELIERAQKTEPMAYLLKPFEAKQVLTTVQIGLSNFARQREIRRSAARFRLIHDYLQDGLLFTDSSGKILSLNHSAETLTGCPRDQATRMELHQLVQFTGAEAGEKPVTADLVVKLMEHAKQSPPETRSHLVAHQGEHRLGYRIARDAGHEEVALVLQKIEEAQPRAAPGAATEAPGAPDPGAFEDLKKAAAQGCYTAVFMINHFSHFRQRFGSSALGQVRLAYEQHIAQNIHDACTVHPWDDRSFVVTIQQELWTFETERAISHVASAALQYFLQLPTRSALLRLTSSVTILPPGAANGLIRRVQTAVEKLSQSAA